VCAEHALHLGLPAQAAALEELGSRDAELSAHKAALEERQAELDAWAAQVRTNMQQPQMFDLVQHPPGASANAERVTDMLACLLAC
jgi:hypothetical protein